MFKILFKEHVKIVKIYKRKFHSFISFHSLTLLNFETALVTSTNLHRKKEKKDIDKINWLCMVFFLYESQSSYVCLANST